MDANSYMNRLDPKTRDSSNGLSLRNFKRIPYIIALKHKHEACAALLNPAFAEPLVWPLPLRFISNLNAEAKALLETALMKANREREKAILKDKIESLHCGSNFELEDENTALSDSQASDADVCCICFEQLFTIEIRECGRQMCAHCVLALCCHKNYGLFMLYMLLIYMPRGHNSVLT